MTGVRLWNPYKDPVPGSRRQSQQRHLRQANWRGPQFFLCRFPTSGSMPENERAPRRANASRPATFDPLPAEGSNMIVPPSPASGTPPTPESGVTDAAWNAVAVASLHWQQSANALRHVLTCAQSHGLTVSDLCWASGIGEAQVRQMLEEASA